MTQQTTPEPEQTAEVQAEQVESTEEVDWKARAEQAETQLKKAQNDLNSRQGRDRTRDEWQHQLADIGDRIGAMEAANQAVIRAFSTGDTDALPSELSTITARQNQTAAARSYEARYAALSEELREAVQDGDGNQVLDLYESPELEEVRKEWVNAHKAKDPAALAAAIGKTHRIARQAERNGGSSAEQRIREEERAAARTRLEAAGIYDLDTGPSGAGAGLEDMDFLNAYGSDPGRYSSKEDRERANRILKNLR